MAPMYPSAPCHLAGMVGVVAIYVGRVGLVQRDAIGYIHVCVLNVVHPLRCGECSRNRFCSYFSLLRGNLSSAQLCEMGS